MARDNQPTSAPDTHLTPLQLSAYADGETSASERAAVQAHLESCDTCSAKVAAIQKLSASLAALPRTTPSASVFERTMTAARRIHDTPGGVARERMGGFRRDSFRLRDVRVPDRAPASVTPIAPRRKGWRAPLSTALPTIAALLLLALTAGLLMRSSLNTSTQLGIATPTATLPTGQTLDATRLAVSQYASELSFTAIAPTWLPSGARLTGAHVTTLAGGAKALDLLWTGGGSDATRTVHLREQPGAAPISASDGYGSRQSQATGLGWQVAGASVWRPMPRVEHAGWSGVTQSRGGVTLLLDAEPAPGAAPQDVVTVLRMLSLSLDAPYTTPSVAIQPPASGSNVRSVARVVGAAGVVWTWDVTLSADMQQRNATITEASNPQVSVSEITTYAGRGILADNVSQVYQIVPGPTTYSAPPSGVTEIANVTGSYLAVGQLWNLGVKLTQLPDGTTREVYDLYRVDTALPEHVYADATTGAVVAIVVDANSPVSPGGPGSAQPYVSTAACPPYTVTYTALMFEPSASLPANEFDTTPQPGWTLGSVAAPFSCPG